VSGARLLMLVCAMQPALMALAATPTIITQAHRAFSRREVRIKRGETIRFSNADEFLHHLFVRAASFNFNSGEQEPGRDIDVVFAATGTFEVRCEIHPRMVVSVTVE